MAALRPLGIRFTQRAQAQLGAIADYITERNPAAAKRVGRAIRTAAEMLRYFPEAGRTGSVSGTPEWVVRGFPYIIVYELSSETPALVVLAVFHAAQNRD